MMSKYSYMLIIINFHKIHQMYMVVLIYNTEFKWKITDKFKHPILKKNLH